MTDRTLPRWLKPANRLIGLLHRVGLRPGKVHLLSIPGRSTGELRTTPVAPLTVNGHLYVVSPVPKSDWVRNALAAGWGQLRSGRTVRRVVLEAVEDAGEREAVLRAFPTEVPQGVSLFVRVGAVSGPSVDDFAAAAPRCAVFRVT
ncbi:nitroreductase/quinone reductase family protein [Kribbella sp. CA-294648]|uniref:nitroreductase/quinone reductase family protein n=1 Tax=Kribbella sp. CA-294648 TaxID=3239948 RepID=UPI003D9241F7